jgi:Flp pilus assembly protein TadD
MATLVFLTWQRAKIFASDEALWQDTVAKNPQAWNAHNNLACNLAERGQIDGAMEHFEISLRLNPQNAEAHRNLGRALALKGRLTEAEPHFRAALKLKPADTETLVTFAGLLAQQGQGDEAIRHFRTALSIKPEVQTRLQLAPLLATTGKTAEAIAEFRQVLAVQTNSFEALNNLAWMLATSPEPAVRNGKEAVLLALQACQLTQQQQPIPFGTLAAAYAETGDFTNAVRAAQTAIDLATATGNTQVAGMNRQLQKLYQSGRAFHTPLPGNPGRKTDPQR